MARLGVWVIVAATAALAAPGCGGNSDSGPIAREDYSTRLAAAYCKALRPCCVKIGASVDPAACEQQFAAVLEKSQPSADAARYDPTAAGRCVDAVTSGFADCSLSRADNELGSTECGTVFVGLRQPGETCKSRAECAPIAGQSVDCQTSDTSSATVCRLSPLQSLPRGKSGDPCVASCDNRSEFQSSCVGGTTGTASEGATCYTSDGLVCALAAANPTCVELPGLDEPCDSFCRPSLFCDATALRCRAQRGDGSSCDQDDVCLNGNCNTKSGICGPDPVDEERCL